MCAFIKKWIVRKEMMRMCKERNKLEKIKAKVMKSTNDKCFFSERSLTYPERIRLKEMVYRDVFSK